MLATLAELGLDRGEAADLKILAKPTPEQFEAMSGLGP